MIIRATITKLAVIVSPVNDHSLNNIVHRRYGVCYFVNRWHRIGQTNRIAEELKRILTFSLSVISFYQVHVIFGPNSNFTPSFEIIFQLFIENGYISSI